MKKIITIMWLIIITGSAFIALHYVKGDKNTKESTVEVKQVIQREKKKEKEELLLKQTPALDTNKTLPSSFKENISLGDQHLANNNPLQAIINYKKATSIKENSVESLVKLAKAYLANHEAKNAVRILKTADTLSKGALEIKLLLTKAHLDAREIEEAKNIIWSLDDNNLEVKYYKAVILILYKQFELSNEIFNSSIEIQATSPKELATKKKIQVYLNTFETFSYYKEAEMVFLNLLLAKALTDTGEYEAAIPILFEVINEKSNYRDAWLVLGYAYLNTGKNTDAIDALSQAYDLDEQKPETLFFLGLSHFANNDINNAIFYLERARDNGFEPKDQVNLKLGDLYLLEENYEEASEKYEDIVSQNTNNLDLFAKIVWLNIEKINNPKKALKYATKSVENYTDNAISHNLAGWAYTANNQYENAKIELKKAIKLNPNFDSAHLNIAWMYQKQGFINLAKEYYKKAYILGQGTSIGNLAAIRFNILTEKEVQTYYQVNITSP